MIQISRKEAEQKINKHWEKAKRECDKVGLPYLEYDIEKRRNYEIETALMGIFGEEHVINEWCPFVWIYCKWRDHCPISELEVIAKGTIGKLEVNGYKAYNVRMRCYDTIRDRSNAGDKE